MDFLEELMSDENQVVPKSSSDTLEAKNNYYVVEENGAFYYFPIKVFPSTEASPLIRFDRSPPVLREGIVVVEKKLYFVTLQDLMRRVIRKSRIIARKAPNDRPDSAISAKPATSSSSTQTILNPVEPTVDQDFEVEVNQAADLAWNEQIESLLGFISEKEGEDWEITDHP